MTEFLAILSIYYMCDAAAATRALTAEEVSFCTQRYEAVKNHFRDDEQAIPGTPEYAAETRAAYEEFKNWEAANPDLVARLRAPDVLH